jgi:lipid II:glycine glycyltransferase (peptidoglycan interpeptide bridge formation enzyme)
VCGKDRWDVLLYQPEEAIEAAMPFYMPEKGIIYMPPFSQTHGIWFNPAMEHPKYTSNLYQKQQICDYFIKHLPKHQYFHQSFHYSFTDWLPFYWKGYHQTTRYNYVLFSIVEREILWNNLSGDICRNIRKAQNKFKLDVKRDVSLEQFMDINTKTYGRQGKKSYCPDALRKLIEIARSRQQGDIWGAYDEEKRLHAAVFVVWQEHCAYLIASGGDPELRKSGGNALVVWTAINDLSGRVASFDFEGSMTKGVEHFFRGFGAMQMPYYAISRGKIGLGKKIIMKIKQQWRKKKQAG